MSFCDIGTRQRDRIDNRERSMERQTQDFYSIDILQKILASPIYFVLQRFWSSFSEGNF